MRGDFMRMSYLIAEENPQMWRRCTILNGLILQLEFQKMLAKAVFQQRLLLLCRLAPL
jgi:hypothetical protein